MSEVEKRTPEELNQTALELAQTPKSIFRRALFGGYRPQDVDQYVERAADVLESLIEENKRLRVELDDALQQENDMRSTVAAAVQSSKHLRETARRESAALIDAFAEDGAADEVAFGTPTIERSVDQVRSRGERLARQLTTAFESHAALLDAIDTQTLSEATLQKAHTMLAPREPKAPDAQEESAA